LAGSLIVLAELNNADFAWLNAMRRQHYPPDRNKVPAHLTMFRSLPPSAEDEVRRSLARAAATAPPQARLSGVMDLDSGAAMRVESPQLEAIRVGLAEEFRGLLSAQDMGRWTPHVTVQNKVEPRVARALLRSLREAFEPRPLAITGLQLVRYMNGDWEPIARWRFR
jgi:hypothetical protein